MQWWPNCLTPSEQMGFDPACHCRESLRSPPPGCYHPPSLPRNKCAGSQWLPLPIALLLRLQPLMALTLCKVLRLCVIVMVTVVIVVNVNLGPAVFLTSSRLALACLSAAANSAKPGGGPGEPCTSSSVQCCCTTCPARSTRLVPLCSMPSTINPRVSGLQLI